MFTRVLQAVREHEHALRQLEETQLRCRALELELMARGAQPQGFAALLGSLGTTTLGQTNKGGGAAAIRYVQTTHCNLHVQ